MGTPVLTHRHRAQGRRNSTSSARDMLHHHRAISPFRASPARPNLHVAIRPGFAQILAGCRVWELRGMTNA